MKAAIFLTGECNLGCSYCYASECPPRPMEVGTLEQSVAFLQARAQGGPLAITLLGGEPLLRPERVERFLDLCEPLAPDLGLCTNGTRLDSAFLERCRRREIQIYLSLDGVREAHDTHRRHRSGAGSFDTVMARVPEVLTLLPRTQASLVITPETAPMLGDSIAFLVDLGFRDISAGLDYSASWTPSHWAVLEREYRRAAQAYLGWMRGGKDLWLSFLDDHILTWISPKAVSPCCSLGDGTLAIGPSGTIYPCIQFVGRDDGSQGIGDVVHGLDESARCRVLCGGGEPSGCEGCALLERCFHWCGCVNWRATGSRNRPPASLCTHERMVIPLADAVAEELYRDGVPAFLGKFYAAGKSASGKAMLNPASRPLEQDLP